MLIVDALNQLDEGENAHQLYWLPWQFPAHVKLITSCIDDPDREETVLKSFEHRKKQHIAVQPLSIEERAEIIKEVPSLSAKSLDELQIGLLLANPATENPLYLLVTLEELRGFGTFEQVDRRIALFPIAERQTGGLGPVVRQTVGTSSPSVNGRRIPKRHARPVSATLNDCELMETTVQQNVPVEDPLTAVFLQVIKRLEYEFDKETA